MFVGSVSIQIDKTAVTFSATLTTPKTVNDSDIESIKLVDKIQSGSCVGGVSNARIDAGNFRNKSLGKYRRYTNADFERFIAITLKDKKIIVANDETEEKTSELYNKLSKMLP